MKHANQHTISIRQTILVLLIIPFISIFQSTLFAEGPGIGKITFEDKELNRSISVIKSAYGHNAPAIVDGYLMLIAAPTEGAEGVVEFWDISDPRNPKLYKSYEDDQIKELREPHGFGFLVEENRTVMASQSNSGMHFLDVTDADDFKHISTIKLPGITGGGYTGAWWLTYQAPYVYVAGIGKGLYIIEAKDPAKPRLVKMMTSSELGGISPFVVHAQGNLLLITGDNDHNTYDITDPENPILIAKHKFKKGYSVELAAGKVFSSGNGEGNRFFMYDMSYDGKLKQVLDVGEKLGAGGYGTIQDEYFISGFSSNLAKFNYKTGKQLAIAKSQIHNGDQDFGIPLGNLIFSGNDLTGRAGGSALIPHAKEPDNRGPKVLWTYPKENSKNIAPTTRFAFSFSDLIKIRSISKDSIKITDSKGQQVQGQYSVRFGVVNFAPNNPLPNNETFTVSISGIRDVSNNLGEPFTTKFSTANGPVAQPTATFTPRPIPTRRPTNTPAPIATNLPTPIPTTIPTSTPVPTRTPVPTPTFAEPESVSCSFKGNFKTEVNNSVQFQPNLSENLQRIVIDFGDEISEEKNGSEKVFSHTYNKIGRYSVIMRVFAGRKVAQCSTSVVVAEKNSNNSSQSSTIAINENTIFTVNPDNDSVTALDARTLNVKWTTNTPKEPSRLTISDDGTVWVTCKEDAEVISINPTSGQITNVISLKKGSSPFGIVNKDVNDLYVSLTDAGKIVRIVDGRITEEKAVGFTPRDLVLVNKSKLYAINQISPDMSGTIFGIILGANGSLTNSTFDSISLPYDTSEDTEKSGAGLPNYLGLPAISPSGTTMVVPAKKDNILRGKFLNGLDNTFESTVRSIASFVDLPSGKEIITKRIDFNYSALPQSAVFDPSGTILFVATLGSNTLEIVDVGANKVIETVIDVPSPMGMVFNEDGSRLYVSSFLDRDVHMFDTKDLVSGTSNSPSFMSKKSRISAEKLPRNVLRGKKVFYNAFDPRMSGDHYVSCASCHLDGGQDGRVWDITQTGEGLRNTQSINGRGSKIRFHWSANFDEIQDFEHVIRDRFGGSGFLTDAQLAQTIDPLGKPKAGLSEDLDALADYVNFIEAKISISPFRDVNGDLTSLAIKGKEIFTSLNCASCHAFPLTSDGKLHKLGTEKESSGLSNGSEISERGLRTPVLFELWKTAPFLHDGRYKNITSFLKSGSHADITKTSSLSDDDLSNLQSYLLQIDSKELNLEVDPPNPNPPNPKPPTPDEELPRRVLRAIKRLEKRIDSARSRLSRYEDSMLEVNTDLTTAENLLNTTPDEDEKKKLARKVSSLKRKLARYTRSVKRYESKLDSYMEDLNKIRNSSPARAKRRSKRILRKKRRRRTRS